MMHFTSTIDSVASILEHGFIFVPNATEIHKELFALIGLDVSELNRGMICFTEAAWDDYELRRTFGNFGICVDANWAFDRGARKVAYISQDSEAFHAIRRLIATCVPGDNFLKAELQQHMNKRLVTEVQKWMRSSIDGAPFVTPPLYSLVLDLLQWVQLSSHKDEREWRIRAPQGANLSMSSGRGKLVERLIKYSKAPFRLPVSLAILPSEIQFIACDSLHETELRRKVAAIGFSSVEIRTYA
jgi:hypothetical protein